MTPENASEADRNGEGGPPEGGAGPRLPLHGRAWPLFGRTLTIYLRHARALLTATVVPLALAVVVGSVAVVLLTLDGTIVNGLPVPLGRPPVWTLVVGGGALLVAVALCGIALGAGVLVGGAALLGRTVAVPEAWRNGWRRLPVTLTWTVLTAASTLAVVLAWVGAHAYGVLPLLVLLATLLLAIPLAPVFVALPVAHLEGVGIVPALAASWRMGRGRRGVHVLFVFAAVALAYAVVPAMTWTAGHLPQFPVPEVHLVLVLTGLASVLVWPGTLLLLTAPVAYSGHSFETRHLARDCDAERVARTLPKPAEGRRPPAPSRTVLVAAVLVVPLLVPGLLMLNPLGALVGSTSEVGIRDDNARLAIAPDDSGGVTLAGWDGGSFTIECDPVCSPPAWVGRSAATQGESQARVGDEFVFAFWGEGSYGIDGFALGTCGDEDCEADPDTTLRPAAEYVNYAYSALAPLGDGMLVVSAGVESDGGALPARPESDLRAHYCADTDCADPRVIDLPALPVGNSPSQGRMLDVAAESEGGGFTVAAHDSESGTVRLISCPDIECADPASREVADSGVASPDAIARGQADVRVLLRPDGTPVVAYRAARDGAVHVVDCQDAACAESTDRAVTGPGSARPAPGFALDSEGRPQLATFDLSDERLVLISCADDGCAESTTVPLADLDSAPAFTELALDSADRPHVVWGQGASHDRLYPVTTRLFSCAEARCGA